MIPESTANCTAVIEETNLLGHCSEGYIIKFGKFRGQLLANVPGWYLDFMYNLWLDNEDPAIRDFIDVLEDIRTGAQHVLTY